VTTDEQLALRLQGGDRGALNGLVERHYSPLLGYLYRMVGGDRALAEDLAQETFLRALRSIAQYRRDLRFKPWLYAIATNLARNHYNRADTRYTQSDADSAPDAPSEIERAGLDEDGLDADLLAVDEVRQVLAALASLPDHQREVVALYYYQSLSLQEIADALSIPLGTVKSRLSLAVRRLREMMKEMDSHERSTQSQRAQPAQPTTGGCIGAR
jgi:RNA polymerase sigma-70 factor, ECF subfamily